MLHHQSPSQVKTLSLLVTAQKTDETLATSPPDELTNSSGLEALKNAAKPSHKDPAHQISVLPDGSASCMLRSTGSEASNPDLRPIPPDLRPPVSDLLLSLQIYARSANISSDLQPPRLDLMLSLQI